MDRDIEPLEILLERIASALERSAGTVGQIRSGPALGGADAFVWEADRGELVPVKEVAHLPLALLKGIDAQRDTLLENTNRFAAGLPANNALLWGARGMGKSSLIKSVHAEVNKARKDGRLEQNPISLNRILLASSLSGAQSYAEPASTSADCALALIEIPREDIASLPHLLRRLRGEKRRVLLFCDDLSFDREDTSYKSLKAALEGGVEGRPANVLFYATSNRRHMMPRDMMENERSTAINPSEAVEEKVSLSDRFGLWLGFHHCGQDEYLSMIRGYAAHFGLKLDNKELEARALAWSAARGARSGRVAWQFTQDLAGALGVRLA